MDIRRTKLVVFTLRNKNKQALYSPSPPVVVQVQVQPDNVDYVCSTPLLYLLIHRILSSRLICSPA